MSADVKRVDGRATSYWTTEDIVAICPVCKVFAVVELTPLLKKLQPDGTTHVCHPGFGGCNHGFTLEES